LKTVSKDGIEIEECGECGGLWLDASELSTLLGCVEPQGPIDSNPSPESSQADPGQNADVPSVETEGIICPKCNGEKLLSFIYDDDTGIELDTCPNCCGLWLDKNEFQQIEFFANMNKETKLIGIKGQELETRRVKSDEEARGEFARRMQRNAARRWRNPLALFVYRE